MGTVQIVFLQSFILFIVLLILYVGFIILVYTVALLFNKLYKVIKKNIII